MPRSATIMGISRIMRLWMILWHLEGSGRGPWRSARHCGTIDAMDPLQERPRWCVRLDDMNTGTLFMTIVRTESSTFLDEHPAIVRLEVVQQFIDMIGLGNDVLYHSLSLGCGEDLIVLVLWAIQVDLIRCGRRTFPIPWPHRDLSGKPPEQTKTFVPGKCAYGTMHMNNLSRRPQLILAQSQHPNILLAVSTRRSKAELQHIYFSCLLRNYDRFKSAMKYLQNDATRQIQTTPKPDYRSRPITSMLPFGCAT